MKRSQVIRMAVDILMTVILLLLMGYSRVGETAHEWLGIVMFTLLIIHHILNRKWIIGNFTPGRADGIRKYSLLRILQMSLVVLLFAGMIGSAVSGVILSKHVFGFLNFNGASKAREIHMLCGYWNFVLMSLHIGLHWSMIVKMISRHMPKNKPVLTWTARGTAILIAGYGLYVLVVRRIYEYLFGLTKFVFIDLEEPLPLFLLDYLAVMGMFVFILHYIAAGIRKLPPKNKQ